MKNNFIYAALASATLTTAMAAESTENISKNDTTFNPVTSFNELGLGTISGSAQALFMDRERGRSGNPGDARTGSIGFTLNYKTGEWEGLSLGAQYIHVWDMFEHGSFGSQGSESLNTSEISMLNHLNVEYNFTHFGLEDTQLIVGRQALSTVWAASSTPRHKSSAYEGATFHTGDIEDFDITIGHFWKYSNWGSENDSPQFSHDFEDIADVEGLPYSTDGVSFAQVTYTGIKDWTVTAYDFYAWDHYNTVGLKIDWDTFKTADWQHTARAHAVYQTDTGKFTDETDETINSTAMQLAWRMQKDQFSIEPGVLIITGNNNSEDSLLTTFTPDFICEYPLLENDLGFIGGATTYYLESSYSWGKNSLWGAALYTDNENDSNGESTDATEFNIVYGRQLRDDLMFKFKTGIVDIDPKGQDGGDQWIADFRFFLDYTF